MRKSWGINADDGWGGTAGRWTLLLLCFLLSSACHAEVPYRSSTELRALPLSKSDCSLCHIVAGGAAPRALTKPLPGLCLDCHPGRTAPSEHKIGVAPERPPAGLPLDNGKITCTTCHDPHSNRFGSLLRVPARDLCLLCHRR